MLEYYWYTKDHETGTKVERLYWICGDVIIIDFDDKQYKVIEPGINSLSVKLQAVLQLECLEDRPEHRNYVGELIKPKQAS